MIILLQTYLRRHARERRHGRTAKENMKAKLIEYNGQRVSLAQLAKEYGLTSGCLSYRLSHGWDIEKALHTEPVRDGTAARYEYRGKMYTIKELAQIHGNISAYGIRNRLVCGMSVEDAVNLPLAQGKHQHLEQTTVIKQPGIYHKFEPHNSPEDKKKCQTCCYSERDGQNYPCMFMALHDPPERRGCEPGQHCIRFEPKNEKTEQKKLQKWVGR